MRTPVLAGLVLLATAPAFAGSGTVVGSVGQRQLDDDFYGPNADQPLIGVLATFAFDDRVPLSLAVGLQASAEDTEDPATGYDYTDSVVALMLGAQLMPNWGPFRPYAGVGVAEVNVSEDVDLPGPDASEDDSTFGYYVNGGLLYSITDHFDIGVDVRWIGGTKIELTGVQGDADSLAISALFGYRWGWGGEERYSRRRRY